MSGLRIIFGLFTLQRLGDLDYASIALNNEHQLIQAHYRPPPSSNPVYIWRIFDILAWGFDMLLSPRWWNF